MFGLHGIDVSVRHSKGVPSGRNREDGRLGPQERSDGAFLLQKNRPFLQLRSKNVINQRFLYIHLHTAFAIYFRHIDTDDVRGMWAGNPCPTGRFLASEIRRTIVTSRTLGADWEVFFGRNINSCSGRGDAFTFRSEDDALKFDELVIHPIVVSAELIEALLIWAYFYCSA